MSIYCAYDRIKYFFQPIVDSACGRTWHIWARLMFNPRSPRHKLGQNDPLGWGPKPSSGKQTVRKSLGQGAKGPRKSEVGIYGRVGRHPGWDPKMDEWDPPFPQ